MDQEKIKKKGEGLIKISLLISFFFSSTYIFSFINWPNIPEYKITFFLNIIFSTFIYFIFVYLFLHYFYLKKKNLILCHFLGILIHYIFIKLILLIYGIQSIKLFFESLKIEFNTLNKLLFITVVILSYFFLIKILFKNFKNYLKFICTFTVIILIYSSYFITISDKLISLNKYQYTKVDNLNIKKNIQKKVNFIVFDEADYELLELKKNKLNLENYIKLQNKSLYFTNAYSPGRDTAQAIPALLLGFPGNTNIKFDRKKIFFENYDNKKKIYFEFKNTIFNLSKNKNAVSIVAGADRKIIYCVYLKIKNCHDITSEMEFSMLNYDGFESITSIINNIFKPYMFDNERQKTDITLINFLNKKNSVVANLKNNKRIDILSFDSLKRDDIEIAYIHYPYPHYPSHFADYILKDNNNLHDLNWYEKNLILLDRTIGEILEILDNTKPSLTIITSDHGLRSLDINKKKIRRVPFMLYFNNISEKNEINDIFYTFNAKKIIEKYLNDKVDNYSDIKKLVTNFKKHD